MAKIKEFLLHKFFGLGGSGAIPPAVDEENRKELERMEDEVEKRVAEVKAGNPLQNLKEK